MLKILAHRAYRHLFAAQVAALIGTGIMTVALSLLAYQLASGNAGAVLGTALALALKMIAYVGLRRWLAPSRTGFPGGHGSSRSILRAAVLWLVCRSPIRSGRSTCSFLY